MIIAMLGTISRLVLRWALMGLLMGLLGLNPEGVLAGLLGGDES